MRRFARGPFSLYVLHMPLMAFAAAYLAGTRRCQPTLPHIPAASSVLTFTVLYAFFVAQFIEFLTDRACHTEHKILRFFLGVRTFFVSGARGRQNRSLGQDLTDASVT
jgi:peptidoglycan/LPS O-acetylase OafA/YrhL